jgi:hypothetical protein
VIQVVLEHDVVLPEVLLHPMHHNGLQTLGRSAFR